MCPKFIIVWKAWHGSRIIFLSTCRHVGRREREGGKGGRDGGREEKGGRGLEVG